jgi:hypothetical protein
LDNIIKRTAVRGDGMKKVYITMVFTVFFLITVFVQPLYAWSAHYPIIPGKEYSVLVGEQLNSEKNAIIRLYDIYSGTSASLDIKGSLHYGMVKRNVQEIIPLPESCDSLSEAKKWVEKNAPSNLRLRPWTIVNWNIINQWMIEGYTERYEYWEDSPRGLVPSQVKQQGLIPKPVLYKDLARLNKTKTPKVYVDYTRILFPEDQPYISGHNEIMIPVRQLSKWLGYKMDFSFLPTGEGVLRLTKDAREIQLSVWWDYIIINGFKIKLEHYPRLTVNERIVVPITIVNYMADVKWDPQYNAVWINS